MLAWFDRAHGAPIVAAHRRYMNQLTDETLADPSPLRRTIGVWALSLYGLSVIVGAGIYVAIGAVIHHAGSAAPLSFLIAGVAAAGTGLCYAELAGRFPEAGGAAAFVREGFGSARLSRLAGVVLTLSVAVGAASIARGAAIYMAALITLPEQVLMTLLVLAFVVIAIIGVRESVGFAAITGALEILGLVAVIGVGLWDAPSLDPRAFLPTGWGHFSGIFSGTFIAFFAFIGFETLANMAEEVRDPRRNVPRGIVCAVIGAIAIYVLVTASVVLSGNLTDAPLLSVFTGPAARLFLVVGFLAVANGVMVQIIMLARLFYGMARKNDLPVWLAKVNARTRTPVSATILAGAIVLATALLLPFEKLLLLTNALTLAVFAIVDLALWRTKRQSRAQAGAFNTPSWLAPASAAISLGLLLTTLFL